MGTLGVKPMGRVLYKGPFLCPFKSPFKGSV